MKGKNTMLRNKELHDFLCEKNTGLTEQWYQALYKKQGGIYSSMNPNVIEKLKQQNAEFHDRFCSMFSKEYEEFLEDFQGWIVRTARDEDRLSTPTTAMLQDFFQTQKQYLQLIEEFASIQGERVSKEQLIAWSQGITATINDLLLEFTTQTAIAAEKRLNAQQELIVEMSAPIILLTKDTGLLPLVGEINTYRAQILFEKALEQSAGYRLERLFIDLSGVPIIDTMVAHQIFQLIDGLRLIGVKTALAGVSPDIAQTAIQLGINFGKIEVYSTLVQAMKLQNLEFIRN